MAATRERGQHEQPWTAAEKNYMLAEIIKANYPPPSVLFSVIVQLGIQPSWNEIPMPPGRSLNSCVVAFDDLRKAQAAPILRGSFGPQTPSPLSAHLPGNRKRPYPYETSFTTGREIRPKPSSAGSGYGQMPMMDHPPKKKRGRPTKAEAQAKAEAQIAGGGPTPHLEGIAPSSAGSAVHQAAETEVPVAQPPPEPPRPILPPAARMPISSIITPTGPPSASQSSSSSGKRKPGRSTRSEPEHLPTEEAGIAREAEEYESPYARMGPESQGTPARAAVLRHREEPESGFRQPSTQEHSAQAPPASRSDPDTK